MKQTLARQIATALEARENCRTSGNWEWFNKHSKVIQTLTEALPSGSGFDNGTGIDLDASKPNRIVLYTSFHHMNDVGMYDGWTDHTVIVTPSFVHGLDLRITGRDRNDIKEYIYDAFYTALTAETEC